MGSRHGCLAYAVRQCLRKTPGGAKLQLNTKLGGREPDHTFGCQQVMHESCSRQYFALLLCLAAAEGCARRHAPVVASERLVVRAELVDRGVRPLLDCEIAYGETVSAITHAASVMTYRPVAVREGAYSGERLYVVHGCPEMPRSMYPEGVGSLTVFAVGDLHDLVLAKLPLPDWSTPTGPRILDRFEDKKTPRYRALRTDQASRDDPVVAEKPSGCFSVAVTDYLPARNLGKDEIFVRLPTRISLSEEPFDGVADRWRLSPGPETPSEIMNMMRGWWEHAEGGGVKIVWTNGFSGVDLTLASASGTWRGQAKTFWDFGRPEQNAEVELHRTVCW